MMTKEKIDELAKRFSENCGIAEERYDEPKYVFAALLTLLEVLEEKECKERMKRIEEALSRRD